MDNIRLIDANELRKKAVPHTRGERAYCADIKKWAVLVSDLDDAPTIDAVPVVHGRWEYNGIPESVLSKCSVCGCLYGSSAFNYYPNCGAKMDAEEEPELIPILCKHASSAKKNEIGETVVYCEMCAAWQNVTLGDCYGNCECQEVDGE